MSTDLKTSTALCRCGEVRFEARGAPIMTATCHCDSCRKAGEGFEALPGAPQALNAQGGTEFVLHRKDRVEFLQGEAMLLSYRLTPQSSTRRVIASCCNSPMFLEFKGGHWLSLYRDRFGSDAPVIEMRTMTGGQRFSDSVPSYKTHSVKFMWRLFAAWAAMAFRAPALKPIREV